MADRETVALTPSDLLGAVQRCLTELSAYLQQPALGVDVNLCRDQMDHIEKLLASFEGMQMQLMHAMESRDGEAARRN